MSGAHKIDKIIINSRVRNGRLLVNWLYDSLQYEEKTIGQLAKNYLSNLERLITHCTDRVRTGIRTHTPSDYGLNGDVSYSSLSEFMKRVNNDDEEDVMEY
jgi:non-ribosomal peptide synthase protein (TIGR01720 family)